MRLTIDPRVYKLFPASVQYTLVVKGLDNTGESPKLLARLRAAEARVRADAAFADWKAHPKVAAWRDAFALFGFNANKCPPSVANLIKRTRAGKDLPFVNKLVCIFNIISLENILPAGADDLAALTGDLVLGPATGAETYIPLGGGEPEKPLPGEIILYDTGNNTVFCRAWCWKNGDASKVLETSRDVSINIDILPPVREEEGRAAADSLVALVREYCGGQAQLFRLAAGNNSLEW